MAELQYRVTRKSRPPLAMAIQFADMQDAEQRAAVTPEELKRIVVDVVSQVAVEDFRNLREWAIGGQITVIV